MCDVPYPHLKNEGQVIYALVEHESPRDYSRESERMVRRSLLLSFCEECWIGQKARPSMRKLANGLNTNRDLTGSIRLLEPVGNIMDKTIRAIYGVRQVDGKIERVTVKRCYFVVERSGHYKPWVSKHSELFFSDLNLCFAGASGRYGSVESTSASQRTFRFLLHYDGRERNPLSIIGPFESYRQRVRW